MAFRLKTPLSGLVGTPDALQLFGLVRDYVKQETLGPLRGAGRWLIWGFFGGIALVFGAIVGLIGVLRLLQTEVFSAHPGLNFLPYCIVMILAMVLIWLSLTRIARPSLHSEG
ncbi:MAG: hypothetical protein D4R44_07650 [Actinobacteria bacterium]|nr:MAG: hypothetical protein D4R44_07650 [Actinomycetota bacterium]